MDADRVVCHHGSMVMAELLVAVQRAPDAFEPRLVLADALQAGGDPQGELIVVQQAMASGGSRELSDRAATLIANLEATIGVPEGARLDWRLGFVDALDLRGVTSPIPGALFQHRAFALLRELRPPDQVTASDLDAWLAPVTPTLRRLRLGHPLRRLDRGVIEVISRVIGLEQLAIAASKTVPLAALAGLSLSSLELRVRGLSLENTIPLLDKLSLSRLTLHLAGCKGELATLEPVIAGAVLPALTHLGLLDAPFAPAFVERLATGAPRTKLRSFVVTPAPVEVLERHRAALADLAVEGPEDADHAAGEVAKLLALGLGRHAEAIPFYDRAIAATPADNQLLWSRAIALRKAGRHEEAVAGWDSIIARRPSSTPALRNRHLALLELGRRVEAREDLERALTIKPEASGTNAEIGDIDLYFGHFESATARYRLALADEWGRQPHFLQNLALSLVFQRRELEEARAILDRLVLEGGDSGLLHVARGFAWLDADPQRAIEAFSAARDRCGGCDASCGELERATIGTAFAHCELGDPATALDLIAGYTQHADCLAHVCVMQLTRAIVHRLAGDDRRAREELERLCPPVIDPEAIALQLAADHATRHPGKARVRIPGGEPAPFNWKTDQAMAAVCALFAAAITGQPLAPRVARVVEWAAGSRPWSMQMWCEGLPLLDRARRWMSEQDARLLTDVLAAIAWPDHPLFAPS